MALHGDWWLTQKGGFEMGSSEHGAFAIRFMLEIPPERHVPNWWLIRGIPPAEFETALARGANPKAVEFLSVKKNDARLWAMREFGWIRTARAVWNCWELNSETAKIARNAKEYWATQSDIGNAVADVYEFKSGDEFPISVARLMAGGDPKILKKLSAAPMDEAVEVVTPQYSSKWTELERRALTGRTSENPRRRR